MRDATDGQRLTQAWNKDYPVPHSAPKPSLVASLEEGLPIEQPPVVTQVTQLDKPETKSSQEDSNGTGKQGKLMIIRKTSHTMK